MRFDPHVKVIWTGYWNVLGKSQKPTAHTKAHNTDVLGLKTFWISLKWKNSAVVLHPLALNTNLFPIVLVSSSQFQEVNGNILFFAALLLGLGIIPNIAAWDGINFWQWLGALGDRRDWLGPVKIFLSWRKSHKWSLEWNWSIIITWRFSKHQTTEWTCAI